MAAERCVKSVVLSCVLYHLRDCACMFLLDLSAHHRLFQDFLYDMHSAKRQAPTGCFSATRVVATNRGSCCILSL